MKKAILFLLLLLGAAAAQAQIRSSTTGSVRAEGAYLFTIHFYDAQSIDEPRPQNRIELDSVQAELILKKGTVHLNSEEWTSISYTEPLRSKEIELILTRPGYDTLRGKWPVNDTSINLEAFLTKTRKTE